MADTSNRLWAGVAVGLLAAAGLLASGILSNDGGQTATESAEQNGTAPAGLTGDGDTPLAMADQGSAADASSTDRPPTLLVVAPEHVAVDQADEPTTSTTLATTTTAAPTTAAPAPSSKADADESKPTAGPDGGDTSATDSSATAATPASTDSSTTTQAPSNPPPPAGNGGFEQQVLDLTNAERRKANCPDLTNNARLHAAALAHSTDMATKGYFSHTGANGSSMSDRVEAQGYSWRGLAENIAAGYRTPQAVVTGWMNSSGHRANILNCDLTELGVGFYDYHWTQNFGTPR